MGRSHQRWRAKWRSFIADREIVLAAAFTLAARPRGELGSNEQLAVGPATNCDPTSRGIADGPYGQLCTVEAVGVQWIYQINDARVVRGDKVILDDVTLGFLPGAKIGVVGPNGAGKSTLLGLMAGLQRPSHGDARAAPGISVGLLAQEPVLDDTKTVLGNVCEGLADIHALRARFDEIAANLAEDYSDEAITEMGSLQEQLDHLGAWDIDARTEQAVHDCAATRRWPRPPP
jgi:ABC-type multidrug transport system fused ATPase/permease subunit